MFLKLQFFAILSTFNVVIPYGGLHAIEDNATSFTESFDAYAEKNTNSLMEGSVGHSSGITQGMFSRPT